MKRLFFISTVLFSALLFGLATEIQAQGKLLTDKSVSTGYNSMKQFNRLCASGGFYGKGGKIGDFLNLMGDGNKSVAKAIGRFLKERVRRK